MAALFGNSQAVSDIVPSEGLTEIRARKSIQWEVVDPVDIIESIMVPVGSNKPGYHMWLDTKNLYRGKPSYRFHAQDDKQTRVDTASIKQGLMVCMSTSQDSDNMGRPKRIRSKKNKLPAPIKCALAQDSQHRDNAGKARQNPLEPFRQCCSSAA